MTDPIEEALAAATRGLQALDQQLAAARDANSRLTAQNVMLEIQLRACKSEYDDLVEQHLSLRERHDNTMDALDLSRDALVACQHALADLKSEAAMLRCAVDDLEGQLTRYRQ